MGACAWLLSTFSTSLKSGPTINIPIDKGAHNLSSLLSLYR